MPILRSLALPTCCLITLSSLLSACGAGADATGANTTSSSTTTTQQTAAGWWTGTVSSTGTSRNIALLVTDTGRFYAIYSASGSLAGMLTGVQTTTGSALSVSGGLDYPIAGSSSTSLSLTGTVTTKSSLNGTLTEGSNTATLATSYDTAYDSAVSAASLAASYAVSLSTLNVSGLSFTLARVSGSTSQYTLTPSDSSNTCRFTVSLTPHSTNGYYDATIATQSACSTQYTAIGIGLPTSATTLVLAAVLPDQSNMLLGTATPQ